MNLSDEYRVRRVEEMGLEELREMLSSESLYEDYSPGVIAAARIRLKVLDPGRFAGVNVPWWNRRVSA